MSGRRSESARRSRRRSRLTATAVVVAVPVQLILVPDGAALTDYATALVVLSTVVLAWVLRDRSAHPVPHPEDRTEHLDVGG